MEKLLIFLAFYLPFGLALNPTEGVDLASVRILIILLFFLWLAEGLRSKKIIIHRSFISAMIIIFLFLSSMSIFMARNADWSGRKLLFLFSIFPLYFAASAIVKSENSMVKVVKVLVWGAALVALVGISEFLAQFVFGLEKVYQFWADFIAVPFLGKSVALEVLKNPSWLVEISGKTYLRATATFPDPHMLSLYLGLTLPLAAGLYLKTKKKIYILLFLIILAADVLTFSRGGYLGLLAGTIFLILVFWEAMSNRFKAFILAFVALVALSFIIPGPVSSRFTSIFDLKEGSNEGRLEMWKKSAEVAMDHPLLGVGIGNYPLEVKASADYREPITAHSTYLDIASETGIMSLAVFLGILIAATAAFLKKSQKNIIFLMAAVSIVIFSAHSLAETSIYSPAVLAALLLIISFTNIKDVEKTF